VSTVGQSEFGGGIFRAPRAPAGSVYDCVNGLIDDERAIYRRGGSVYKTTSDAGSRLRGLAAVTTAAGNRVLAWSTTVLYLLSVAEDTADMASVTGVALTSRVVSAGPVIALRLASGGVLLYGGARLPNYSTGTIAVATGSKVVTGSGTAWLANVDPGMILTVAGSVEGVVETVDSNTQVTLRDAATHTQAAGTAYQLSLFAAAGPSAAPVVADALASAGDRLLVCKGEPHRVFVAGDVLDHVVRGVGAVRPDGLSSASGERADRGRAGHWR
jgi:hypothetical protein